MRLSYATIRKWLASKDTRLTLAQWDDLEQLVSTRALDAAQEAARYKEALARAQEIAAEVGLSVEELVARAVPGYRPPAATNPDGPAPRSSIRRPYMNPFSNDGKIYAISLAHPDRKLPDWWIRARQEGWSLEECHYKRLASAWKARGLKPLYDPVAAHAQIIELEPVRYQRPKKASNLAI